MSLTPEERIDRAEQALIIANVWFQVAGIILTGGDPKRRDHFEVMQKAGESKLAGERLIGEFMGDMGD